MPSETSTPLSAKLMFRTFSFLQKSFFAYFPLLLNEDVDDWPCTRLARLFPPRSKSFSRWKGGERRILRNRSQFFTEIQNWFFLQIQRCKLFIGFKMQKRLRCKSDSFLKPMEILGKRNGNSYKKKWKFLEKEMEKNGIIVFAKESLRSCLRPIVSMVSLLLDDQILSFLAIRHNSIAQRGFQSSLVFFHSMSATILFNGLRKKFKFRLSWGCYWYYNPIMILFIFA